MTQHRLIAKLATPKQQKEGGGFLVRKVIGGVVPTCDPFIMLDHFGPAVNKPGEAVGAPDHPHRGFETVTYIIDGDVLHQDSVGNKSLLSAGWVQWMTAGSGVVHSEMPSPEMMKKGGKMEGFQLWVNLPSKLKMIAPRYQDISPDKLPLVTKNDGAVSVKVIAGETSGAKAVIETHTKITCLDIHLKPGAAYVQQIPETFNGFAYVWRGAGFLGNEQKRAHMGQVGILGSFGTDFEMKAEENEECRILLCVGEPIKEPIVHYGPFVMNTQEQISQAIKDYREGKLGSIPGKEKRIQAAEAAAALQRKNGQVD